MENIYFDFKGNTYSGYIVSEQVPEQGYLWFVFNDEEMISLFGDSVAFYVPCAGKLCPVYLYTTSATFIEYLTGKVEDAFFREQELQKQYGSKQHDHQQVKK